MYLIDSKDNNLIWKTTLVLFGNKENVVYLNTKTASYMIIIWTITNCWTEYYLEITLPITQTCHHPRKKVIDINRLDHDPHENLVEEKCLYK